MAAGDCASRRFPVPGPDAANPHLTWLTARKSRFLAQGCQCASPGEAREFIARVRALHPDATHNCWAFVAGPPGSTMSIGSSDDGEPHGTAGKPILQALLHCGLGRICMVVTRWFGGVKLGTGGLARAYQQSALENIASMPVAESVEWQQWKISADYASLDAVLKALPMLEARIENADYQARAELFIALPADRAMELASMVAKVSNGRAVPQRMDCNSE